MARVRALIVDDEAVARRRIRRLLSTDTEVMVVGECADGATAVDAIARERPDIVFLDVQMPELGGFAVVSALDPDALPAIVFVTAFDRYALQAFDVHAIDYLLKPYTPERFRTAVQRAKARIQGSRVDASLASFALALHERPRYVTRLPVKTTGKIVLVDVASVDWIEAADNYVRLHVGTREYLHRETLAGLERQLDPDRFARIHRSAIVQIDRIAELHPVSHGDADLILRNGTMLTLSRTHRDSVDAKIRGRSAERRN
jgi:two-component system, LytTR family, response regulator